ncbi:hypothetical protein [Vibrio owensii]|uniref:hypothetical protein n=1 Tax=Vibrio owensii TaxID=696485 RepID=UPI0018F169BE|nr:hypothetical protein [Vibrio owensii]
MNHFDSLFNNYAIGLREVLQSYLKGETPETLKKASEYLHKAKESAPAPYEIDHPDYFNQLNEYSKFRSLCFGFHQSMVEIGIYAPISKEGCNILNTLINGRQIIDPIAGRGFIAKGLRELGANVLAGDLHPHNPVTEIEQIHAMDLITKADDDAILLLAWPPTGNLDHKLAKRWGEREIILIGEPGGCTGSQKFCNQYEAKTIDTPDDVLLHLNHEWSIGKFTGN